MLGQRLGLSRARTLSSDRERREPLYHVSVNGIYCYGIQIQESYSYLNNHLVCVTVKRPHGLRDGVPQDSHASVGKEKILVDEVNGPPKAQETLYLQMEQ